MLRLVESPRLTARVAARQLASRVAAVERHIVAALVVAAGGIYAFVAIADEILEKEAHAFDNRVLLLLRTPGDLADPIGPAWFESLMRDCTALGSHMVLALVTLGVVGFLLATKMRRAAVAVAIAAVGGMILSASLKWGFARPRPDIVPHAMQVHSESFPSGHAMLSATVYLTLGMMLARTQSGRGVKVFCLAFATLLTLIVGISRVYLGVHWPTDVLAGWAGGAAWASLAWLLMYWLQRKGEVEPEAPEAGAAAAQPR